MFYDDIYCICEALKGGDDIYSVSGRVSALMCYNVCMYVCSPVPIYVEGRGG